MPLIHRLLDLSTAHLPEDLGTSDLDAAPGVIAYRTEHGWLMWVPDNPDQFAAARIPTVPEVVLAVQRYARSLGCDYVLLDADAERVDDLPAWTGSTRPILVTRSRDPDRLAQPTREPPGHPLCGGQVPWSHHRGDT